MASFTVAVALLISVLCVVNVHSDETLPPFGEKVNSLIPQVTYNKLFAVNAEDFPQLLKDFQKGQQVFEKVMGAGAGAESSIKQKEASSLKKLGLSGFTPSVLFQIKVNTIGQVLKKNGKLDNVDDMAQKFVDELNKSAMTLNSNDFQDTFEALTTAEGNFFTSVGLNSAKTVNQFRKIFNSELQKQ